MANIAIFPVIVLASSHGHNRMRRHRTHLEYHTFSVRLQWHFFPDHCVSDWLSMRRFAYEFLYSPFFWKLTHLRRSVPQWYPETRFFIKNAPLTYGLDILTRQYCTEIIGYQQLILASSSVEPAPSRVRTALAKKTLPWRAPDGAGNFYPFNRFFSTQTSSIEWWAHRCTICY